MISTASVAPALKTVVPLPALKVSFHPAFVIAWVFYLIFYFGQYALRSAPGVMMPELT